MRALPLLPTLLIGLLLVPAASLLGPVGLELQPLAFAEDAPEESSKELWAYTKGEERRELDVTSMSPELRAALDTQLQATGWKRIKASQPAPTAAGVSEATAQDIAELIRRGGKLPEGYVPHGLYPPPPPPTPLPQGATPPKPLPPLPIGATSPGAALAASPQMLQVLGKATGTLLLRYLEVKDDPVKGPVYEDMLRLVATHLQKGGAARPAELGMQVMGKVMGGMQDPAKAPAYREMLTVFGPAIGAVMGGGQAPAPARPAPPTPGRPPAEAKDLPFGGQTPTRLGGALLAYSQWLAGSAAAGTPASGWAVIVAEVPPRSTAAAVDLREGDRIEAIDGKSVDAAGLRKAADVLANGGQLILRLRRRNGQVEQLEMDVQLED